MNLSAQNKPADHGKRIFLSAVAALMSAAALFLTGCILNPSGLSDGSSGTETPNRRDIFAKWEITDPCVRFSSIELTDNDVYIVILREESSKTDPLTPEAPAFYTGKYTASGDSIVYLIDFGILEIELSSNKTSIGVKLHIAPNLPSFNGETFEFNAEKALEITSSNNTDLLCRHWKFVRFLLNGELWEPWKEPEKWESGWQFPKSEPQITNLFSKSGTYLQTSAVNGEETITVLGQWRWTDGDENAFYHTDWKTGDWQANMVHVTLTETAFATVETLNYGYILITEFELF